MPREPLFLGRPVPEPLALIDATLLFLIQVLLAHHPDLLASADPHGPRSPPGRRTARHLLDAVRDLHHVLELYRIGLPDAAAADDPPGDDFPF